MSSKKGFGPSRKNIFKTLENSQLMKPKSCEFLEHYPNYKQLEKKSSKQTLTFDYRIPKLT